MKIVRVIDNGKRLAIRNGEKGRGKELYSINYWKSSEQSFAMAKDLVDIELFKLKIDKVIFTDGKGKEYIETWIGGNIEKI